jgi:hypothetical protein
LLLITDLQQKRSLKILCEITPFSSAAILGNTSVRGPNFRFSSKRRTRWKDIAQRQRER